MKKTTNTAISSKMEQYNTWLHTTTDTVTASTMDAIITYLWQHPADDVLGICGYDPDKDQHTPQTYH